MKKVFRMVFIIFMSALLITGCTNYTKNNELISGYPEGVSIDSLNKKEVGSVKEFIYSSAKDEDVKINNDLSLLFRKLDNIAYFDIVYKNNTLNLKRTDDEQDHKYEIDFSSINNVSLTVYKIGDNYLIQLKQLMGQTYGSYLFMVYSNGTYTEVHKNLTNKEINNIKYLSGTDVKSFYLITLSEISEGDYQGNMYTYYIYEN